MRRAMLVTLVLMTTAAVLSPSAGAQEPERFRAYDEFDIDFGEDLCGFPLLAHVVQTTTFHMFFDRNHDPVRGLLTGPITVWFTNGDTGTTRRLSIPGPTFTDAEGIAVRGTGTWVTMTIDGDFVWAAGNMVLDEFNTILSLRGRARPVCGLVA